MEINALMSFGSVMSTIGSVLLALLILLIMITVHEFGHYTAGKIFKFGIKEFAIGFGPALFKKKKKDGEIFSIRAFPIGGFCSFEGEDEDNSSPTAFNNQKPWKRIIVLVSGAFMNFITALILIIILFSIYGQSMLSAFEVKAETDPIYMNQSLVDGDVIVKIESTNVYMTADLQRELNGKKKGEAVEFTVIRNGKEIKQTVVLREDINVKNSTEVDSLYRGMGLATLVQVDEVGENCLFKKGDYITRAKTSDYEYDESKGYEQPYFEEARIYDLSGLSAYLKTFEVGNMFEIWVNREVDGELKKVALKYELKEDFNLVDKEAESELLAYLGLTKDNTTLYNRLSAQTARLGFFQTLGRSVVYAVKLAGTIFKVLGELITGSLGLNAMGGTVTTIVMTSQIVSRGFNFFLEIAAYIGVNLAVFNLLPIPALDGSRVVFTLIEWIRKKPINRNVEGVIHFVGLILLLGFAVLVDLLQLF